MKPFSIGLVPRVKPAYSVRDLVSSIDFDPGTGAFQNLRVGLQALTGMECVLPTASGRGALYLLLKALGSRKVIVPGFTCSAVPEAVIRARSTVVTVDLEPGGFNVDVSRLEKVLEPGSVLVATHQYGIPCAIGEMLEIARRRGAIVIEDVAAALGSRVDGRPVGSFGDAAFYSFDTTKLVNVASKAGFLTVRDPNLFRRVEEVFARETRPQGPSRRLAELTRGLFLKAIEPEAVYRLFHLLWLELRGRATEETGRLSTGPDPFFEGRMSPEQAIQALPQLAGLARTIDKRRVLYRRYQEALGHPRTFVLPPVDVRSEWACIRFPILVPGGKDRFYREAVRLGIDFAFSFSRVWCSDDCRESLSRASEVLDIPFYGGLGEAGFAKVVNVLKQMDRQGAR